MKNLLCVRKKNFQKWFLFLANVSIVISLYSQELEGEKKIFKKPLLFVIIIFLFLFIYKYLDVKKKRKK